MADLQLYLEAERRGLLPADKQALLDEARSRGLIEGLPKIAPKVESEIPQRKYALSEVPGEAISHLPESFGRFVSGTVETIKHPSTLFKAVKGMEANALDTLNAPPEITKAIKSVLTTGQLFGPLNDLYDRLNPTAQKENKAIADSITKDMERKYGSYENFKRAIAEDPVSVANDLSIAFTGGASLFSKSPVISSKLTTAAKYTNPMTPIVGSADLLSKIVTTPIGKVRNAFTPTTSTLGTITEGRAPAIQNKLLQATPDIVPGSKPTVAELASDVSGTLLPAFQKEIFAKHPTAPTERAIANDAARIAQIKKISQTEDAITALKELRDTNAAENYGSAFDASIIADPSLLTLMKRPSMNEVLAKAKELAKEKGDVFQSGANIPATQVTTKNPLTLGTIEKVTPEKFAEYPVKSLHYIKMAFDDLLDPTSTTGFKGNKANAVRATRNEFLSWLESKSDAYKLAREQYATESLPINKAEIGKILEDKLTDTLNENKIKGAGRQFAAALNKDEVPKSITTGAARFKSLSELYSPEEMQVLKSISADIARQVKTEQLATAGAKAGSQIARLDKSPAMISKVATVTNYIIDRLSGKISDKMAVELAAEMLNDPTAFAARLDKVLARQKYEATYAKSKAALGSAIKSAPARSAVQINNALANQQNQNALNQ